MQLLEQSLLALDEGGVIKFTSADGTPDRLVGVAPRVGLFLHNRIVVMIYPSVETFLVNVPDASFAIAWFQEWIAYWIVLLRITDLAIVWFRCLHIVGRRQGRES